MTLLEDYVLLAVLRNCKFNLKKSETKLKHFVSKRREVVKMLADVDMEKIEHIIDDFCFGILPYRDKHGRAIVYTRPCEFYLQLLFPVVIQALPRIWKLVHLNSL